MFQTLKIIALLFLLSIGYCKAEDGSKRLYKGTVGNRTITLYLRVEPNQCGATDIVYGIYKYGNSDSWILLDIQKNTKNNYALTEVGFTGVLIIKETKDGFSGIWISPDATKQLPIKLTEQAPLSTKEKEKLDKELDDTNYQYYDC
ncbi:MAG: hypothetical protein EOO47_08170 [Flavobacterium sp.]|nr:MAG: hypothetical protein EOO47_08170 [Flavobacterium sp.]